MGPHRVLVTGASGFIGRRVLAPLVELGFEVHAASRDAARIPEIPGARRHAADLLVPGAGQALLRSIRPTHVLHLAWYAEHGLFWSSPRNLDWQVATLALLRDFGALGGGRFVGAGTCAEYDWGESPSDEDRTPLRPANLYGAAKASTFLTGAAFARDAGIGFAWGRIFHLYGRGEDPRRLVPSLVRAHVRGEALECGAASLARDYLPAEAVASAFAHLCASSAAGAVNIGSGREVTLEELSAAIADLAGRLGDIRFGARDGGPERLAPVVRRLIGETGWRPPGDPLDGLRSLVDAERGS